eukprot:1935351-Rhodomonas_salina.2
MGDVSTVKSVEAEKSVEGVDAATIGETLEAVDIPRQSLLDVVMSRARDLQLLEKIQRVVIAGKFKKSGDNGEGTREAVDETVRQVQSQDEDEGACVCVCVCVTNEGHRYWRARSGWLLARCERCKSQETKLRGSSHPFISSAPSRTRACPIPFAFHSDIIFSPNKFNPTTHLKVPAAPPALRPSPARSLSLSHARSMQAW